MWYISHHPFAECPAQEKKLNMYGKITSPMCVFRPQRNVARLEWSRLMRMINPITYTQFEVSALSLEPSNPKGWRQRWSQSLFSSISERRSPFWVKGSTMKTYRSIHFWHQMSNSKHMVFRKSRCWEPSQFQWSTKGTALTNAFSMGRKDISWWEWTCSIDLGSNSKTLNVHKSKWQTTRTRLDIRQPLPDLENANVIATHHALIRQWNQFLKNWADFSCQYGRNFHRNLLTNTGSDTS